MTNQVYGNATLSFLADGASTTLLINLMRSPLTSVSFVPNAFGGVAPLPKTVTAAGPEELGPIAASLDTLGNVLLTFTAGAPTAGVHGLVTLIMTFA